MPMAPRVSRAALPRMMAFNFPAFPGFGGSSAGSTGGSAKKGGVLVVGATGRTGKRVVQVLQSQGKAVTAGVRSLEKGQETLNGAGKGKPLAFLEIDVEKDSPAELAEKLAGFSAVVW